MGKDLEHKDKNADESFHDVQIRAQCSIYTHMSWTYTLGQKWQFVISTVSIQAIMTLAHGQAKQQPPDGWKGAIENCRWLFDRWNSAVSLLFHSN